jgi:hypothetical protein
MRYGLRPPGLSADIVRDQLWRAHRYYNDLIEHYRVMRTALRAIDTRAGILAGYYATALEADAEVVRLVQELRDARKKNGQPPAIPAAIATIRDALSAARRGRADALKHWSDARKAAAKEPAVIEAKDKIQEEWLASRRRLRAESGLCHGTYTLAEDSAQQAHGTCYLWDGVQPTDPRFRRWTGEGSVSVQVVGGISVDDLHDENYGRRQVRIAPGGSWLDNRDPNSRRSQIRKRMTLRLRVGTVEGGRDPIWAEWPMIVHRPLPPGAVVKRVTVMMRKHGPREEWVALLTVQTAPPVAKVDGPAVGIDIGWRLRPDGSIRYAYTEDSAGVTREHYMPAHILDGIRKADELRSVRDQHLDDLRPWLAGWICEYGSEALRERAPNVGQWKSPARFVALAWWWRGNRFDGDAETFKVLEKWRYRDYHLWQYEANQRTGALRNRREEFRILAARLADHYATAVVEKFDLRKMAQLPDLLDDGSDNPNARSNRHRVAVSTFRDAVKNAFAARGGKVVEIPAELTTMTCAECGAVEEFDAAANLQWMCANGHTWDQDANAARNILARWRAPRPPEAARVEEDAAPTETRRQRTARLRQERLDRMDRSQDDAV